MDEEYEEYGLFEGNNEYGYENSCGHDYEHEYIMGKRARRTV